MDTPYGESRLTLVGSMVYSLEKENVIIDDLKKSDVGLDEDSRYLFYALEKNQTNK